jgi:hypothetical protein
MMAFLILLFFEISNHFHSSAVLQFTLKNKNLFLQQFNFLTDYFKPLMTAKYNCLYYIREKFCSTILFENIPASPVILF